MRNVDGSTKWIKGLLVALLLAGCGTGNDDATQTGGGRGSSDALRAVDCRGDAPAALALEGGLPALRHVPADDVKVLKDGQPVSLCDLLRGTGKTLALFQFVSVKAYPTLKWAEAMEAGMAGYEAGVLHVVVVTDDPVVTSDADMAALAADVAPGATWVRDAGGAYRFFAQGDDPTKVTPLTIVMDVDARGFPCETPSFLPKDLVGVANQLMKLDVKPAS